MAANGEPSSTCDARVTLIVTDGDRYISLIMVAILLSFMELYTFDGAVQ